MNTKLLNPFNIEEVSKTMSDNEIEDMLARLKSFVNIYNRKSLNSLSLQINYCYYFRELEHRRRQKQAHHLYEKNNRWSYKSR